MNHNPANLGFNFPAIIGLSLLVIFVLYITFTAILYYHWKTYGIDKKITGTTMFLYFVTTIPILMALFIIGFIII